MHMNALSEKKSFTLYGKRKGKEEEEREEGGGRIMMMIGLYRTMHDGISIKQKI